MTGLYKVLGPNAQSVHGGEATWHKPKGSRPGKWMAEVADVQCCYNGYHLVEVRALTEWLTSDCTIYLAEGRGPSHTDGTGKTAFARARLLRQVHISEKDSRLFAADCAQHVLKYWTARYPDDTRPAEAIKAARAYARRPSDKALAVRDAARLAAGLAAERASWSSVEPAAWSAAWSAVESARDVARDAAWSAAWGAAWKARDATWHSGSAAWSAERDWQGKRLGKYLTEEKSHNGPL